MVQRKNAIKNCFINTCIRQGCSIEETKELLLSQFDASCVVCVIYNMGHCPCDGHNCFVEAALKTYMRVAEEKCEKKEKTK